MGGFWNQRNVRIIFTAALATFAVCICSALVVGLALFQFGGGLNLSAATGLPVTGTGIELTPNEGYAGTELAIAGHDWRPGDVIFIRLQGPAGQTDERYAYAGAVVDEQGRFTASFFYPYDPQWLQGDTVQIVARSEASGMQATAPFRLVPPTVMPTPTQDPTATWTPRPLVPTPLPGEPTFTPLPPTPAPTAPPAPPITAWKGAYYMNPHLQGQPSLIRDDQDINFEWGMGAPAPGFPVDNFSVQWTRALDFEGGNYRFATVVDDGVKLWVDDQLLIDQWHDSGPVTYVADVYLTPGRHTIRMDYYEHVGWSTAQLRWQRTQTSYANWKGEYYNNQSLSGNPVLVRDDAWVDFNWGSGSPGPNIPADSFSVRWERTSRFDAGDYRFHLQVDDGARLWVNDQLVIDQWHDSGPTTYTADLRLAAGDYRVKLEYYEHVGSAEAHLWWERRESSYSDWKGAYYSNRSLSGDPLVVRNDARPDFDWGSGSPASGIPSDNFSVRWTRKENFNEPAMYRFKARVDDGVRVWVGGDLVIDEWKDGADRTVSGTKWIDKSEQFIQIDYYDREGNARITVWWEKEQATATPKPSATATLVPTATSGPSATSEPTSQPTAEPTSGATSAPTTEPTAQPTAGATAEPTQTAVPPVTAEPAAPAFSLSPTEGPVGTTIVVHGSNWPAGQQVVLTLAKLQPGMAQIQLDPAMAAVGVTTGEDGTFEGSITVAEEQGWAGEPGALVVAYTPDFSKSAVAQFTIVPGAAATNTAEPTAEASAEPEPTEQPAEPTAEPTAELPATAEPTEPTAEPTEELQPTAEPTAEPAPTEQPSEPTAEPGVSLPVLSLFPISGTVGITVTAHGEAWPAGGQVGFTLAQPLTQEGVPQVTLPLTEVAQTGELGTFDQPLWLPGDGGWELTPFVLVVARTADGQFEVTVPYTVTVPAGEPGAPAP